MSLSDPQRNHLEQMRQRGIWDYAVPQENGCWEWTLPKKNGYGYCLLNGRPCEAHRIAYALTHGDLPDGMVIHHKCLNPRCANPAHLEAMTNADHLRLHRQLRAERRRAKEASNA